MEYEIMVKEVNELKNADLKENTLKIINAQNSLKKNQWDIVNALGVILMEKQWADDFESQNKFGEYLGVTTGTMSQYKNAYRFVQLTKADCDKLSVANAYLLSTFIKEEETVKGITSDFSEYLKFESWCKEKEVDFISLSQKKLREKIKEYYKDKESTENASETAGENASETVGENASETAGENASETTGANVSETTGANVSETAGENTSENVSEVCNKLEYCLTAIHELTAEELKELRKEINKLLK